jgi:hypothetical protein
MSIAQELFGGKGAKYLYCPFVSEEDVEVGVGVYPNENPSIDLLKIPIIINKIKNIDNINITKSNFIL